MSCLGCGREECFCVTEELAEEEAEALSSEGVSDPYRFPEEQMKNSKLVTYVGIATSFLAGLAAINWTAVGGVGQKIAIGITIAGGVVAALGKALGEPS